MVWADKCHLKTGHWRRRGTTPGGTTRANRQPVPWPTIHPTPTPILPGYLELAGLRRGGLLACLGEGKRERGGQGPGTRSEHGGKATTDLWFGGKS